VIGGVSNCGVVQSTVRTRYTHSELLGSPALRWTDIFKISRSTVRLAIDPKNLRVVFV
jgi:hypothetical protein